MGSSHNGSLPGFGPRFSLLQPQCSITELSLTTSGLNIEFTHQELADWFSASFKSSTRLKLNVEFSSRMQNVFLCCCRRTVPADHCQVQFLMDSTATTQAVTIITSLAAFYLPVTVMAILYFKIFLETRKRQKELQNLQAGK